MREKLSDDPSMSGRHLRFFCCGTELKPDAERLATFADRINDAVVMLIPGQVLPERPSLDDPQSEAEAT